MAASSSAQQPGNTNPNAGKKHWTPRGTQRTPRTIANIAKQKAAGRQPTGNTPRGPNGTPRPWGSPKGKGKGKPKGKGKGKGKPKGKSKGKGSGKSSPRTRTRLQGFVDAATFKKCKDRGICVRHQTNSCTHESTPASCQFKHEMLGSSRGNSPAATGGKGNGRSKKFLTKARTPSPGSRANAVAAHEELGYTPSCTHFLKGRCSAGVQCPWSHADDGSPEVQDYFDEFGQPVWEDEYPY